MESAVLDRQNLIQGREKRRALRGVIAKPPLFSPPLLPALGALDSLTF